MPGGIGAMRYLEPILAAVCFALLLLAGILALESNRGVFGPSAGAAVAVAVLAAFFVVYDMMKREGGASQGREGEKSQGKATVTPRIPLQDLEIIDAVTFEKSPGASMLSAIEGVDKSTPAAMRIVFPAPGSSKANPYDAEHLIDQMNILKEYFRDGFGFVYFVRHNKQFLAFADRAKFMDLLAKRESARPLLVAINGGLEQEFLTEPDVDDTVVESSLTNQKALQHLATVNKVRAMIVKTANQRPVGIIDWATLVRRVIAKET